MVAQSLLVLSLLGGALSVLLIVLFEVRVRGTGTLHAADDFDASDVPKISMVIPARNEEQDIEAALRSVLAQRHVDLEVIVVNDHSTDRTGEILHRLAEQDSRIRIVEDPPLRPGWLGKPNAMDHGVQLATADSIIFTDADVVHAPAAFATAMRTLRDRELGFLSLLSRVDCEVVWDNVVLPLSLVTGLAAYAGKKVNDPASPAALGAGAFLLIRRDVLDDIGGVAAIKAEVLDDISLARVVKRRGHRVRFHLAPDLLHVRLFKDNRHAFWGFSKNVLSLTGGKSWIALPAMLLPLFFFWIPPAAVAMGIVQRDFLLLAAGLVTPLAGLTALLLVRPLCRFRWRWAVFFPLSAIPVICVLAKAFYEQAIRGTVVWRDREIKLSRNESE